MRPDDLVTLQQFFGGTFHQDWDVAGETAADVIESYKRKADAHRLPHLAALLVMYVDEHPDDAELPQAVHRDLWCEYVPDGPMREWLLWVAARLRAGNSDPTTSGGTV